MNSERRDHYLTLETTADADQEEIRKAFRRLALKHHPDVSKKPDATIKFQEINEAYQVLSDPDSKRRYDLIRSRSTAGRTTTATGAGPQQTRKTGPAPDWQSRTTTGRPPGTSAGTTGKSARSPGPRTATSQPQNDSTQCPECKGKKNPGFRTCYGCRPKEEKCPRCGGFKRAQYPTCYRCSHP